MKRLLLALGASAGAIVLLEGGLRLAHFEYPPVEKPIVLWSAERDPSLETKGGLFQRDLHALWSLRPGAEIPLHPIGLGAIDAGAIGDGAIGAGAIREGAIDDARSSGATNVARPTPSSDFAREKSNAARSASDGASRMTISDDAGRTATQHGAGTVSNRLGDRDVERVNAAGYRGPLVPFERPRGSLRIMVLGDSAAFGTGVRYEDTFSGRLAAMLEDCGVKAEVIDAGIEGYTIRQGLERYRSLGKVYKPSIVIAAFSGENDSASAHDLADEAKMRVELQRQSGLSGFVRRLRRHARTLQLAAWIGNRHALSEVLAASEADRRREHELAHDFGEPDWTGQRRVSPSEFAMFLAELRRETSADGARFILVAMPHRTATEEKTPVLRQYTRAIFTTAIAEDAQVLNAQGRFDVRAKNDGTEAALLRDEWNPTALGHDLMAQWLLALVREQGRNRGSDPADSLR